MILKTTTHCIAALLTATVLPNGSLFGGELMIASGETTDKGCCSLNFKTCIDWCGQTKDSCLNCDHHDGVGWLPNGKPQEKCKKRWKGCKNDKNGCCDGLTCQKNDNNFLMCMPSLESELFSPPVTRGPTNSPTKVSSPPANDPSTSPMINDPIIVSSVSPTRAPNTSPTTKEELTEGGCCSLNYKTCIDWCGPTKDSCLNCDHEDGVVWLPNGKPEEKCRKRWKGCKNDMNGCCDGLTCRVNENNSLMCLPLLESNVGSPSKTPIASPIAEPISKDDSIEDGCCSLNFKTCIDWCGPTKESCLNCDHHDGVFWLPNGKPQEKCRKRWKGCKKEMNGCCDGLTCQKNENDFLMCLPSLELEVGSPSKTPNASPTAKPTTENNLNGEGCCSLNFKTCIDWCGPTKDSCLNCDHHDGVFWLPNGKPQEKCRKRWKGCKKEKNNCCDGLTCQENENNFLMCLPSQESEDSSPPAENPTNSPIIPTVSPTFTPTFNPTKSPTKLPTERPTKSPTTENPTSPPTATEYPTFTPTTFMPTVTESTTSTDQEEPTGSLRGAENRKM